MSPMTHHHPAEQHEHTHESGKRPVTAERPDHGGHDRHAGHGAHGEVFRRLFWWNLLLAIPVFVSSEMVQEWFGYELTFRGADAIAPVLGTVIFVIGGRPFLTGAVFEIRERATRHDAADRRRDQRRVRRVVGRDPRCRRPRLLVGARGVDRGHAARALARDACDRSGIGRPRCARRAVARRSRTCHHQRCRARLGERAAARRRGARPPRRPCTRGWHDRRRRRHDRRVDDHRRVPSRTPPQRRPRGRRHGVDRLVAADSCRRRW